MVDAQTWLNNNYNNKDTTEEIINSKKEAIEGEIVIEGFSNLKKIDLSGSRSGSKITKFTIVNCSQVQDINISFNEVKEVVGIEVLNNLETLNIAQNKITNIDLLKNLKLRVIICFNNPISDGSININDGVRFFNGNNKENFVSLSVKGEQKKKLLEIAKDLGIGEDELKDKTLQEVEELIKDKVKELSESKEDLEKIEKKLPDLVDSKTGKLDETKLDEIKEQVDIAKELEKSEIKSAEDAKKLLKKVEAMKDLIITALGPDYLAQIEVPTL